MVESLGNSGRKNKIWREVDRCVAARDQGGDEPRCCRCSLCAGARLHSLEGVLSRCAFRAVELHVPVCGSDGSEAKRGSKRLSLGPTRRSFADGLESADANSFAGGNDARLAVNSSFIIISELEVFYRV